MFDNTHHGRRDFLRTAGSAVAITGLAGCSGVTGSEKGYPNKEITWIVPYSTGGGFDSYSRAIAEYLPKHLPNEVEVVVQNVTGAGGRKGANQIFRADPDGYTVGIWNLPGFIAAQLAMDTEYDLKKASWFGRAARSVYMLVVDSNSDFETLKDVQNADEFKLAQTAPGATGWIVDVVASKEMGINNKEVTGYDGSQEQAAAVLRGDVDGFFMATSSPSIKQPVKEGDFRPIVVLGEEAPEYASDVTTADEADYSQLTQIALQRMLGAPPELPKDKLEILSDSVSKTLSSEEMQQWAEKQGRPIVPVEGYQEANSMVDQLFNTYEKYTGTFQETIQG